MQLYAAPPAAPSNLAVPASAVAASAAAADAPWAELVAILATLGLSSFSNKFKDQAVTSVQQLLSLSDDDIRDLIPTVRATITLAIQLVCVFDRLGIAKRCEIGSKSSRRTTTLLARQANRSAPISLRRDWPRA